MSGIPSGRMAEQELTGLDVESKFCPALRCCHHKWGQNNQDLREFCLNPSNSSFKPFSFSGRTKTWPSFPSKPLQSKLDFTESQNFNPTLIPACFCALLRFSFPGKQNPKLKSDAPAALWCPWLLQSRVRSFSKGPEDSQCPSRLIPAAWPPPTQPRNVLRTCCCFFLLFLLLLLILLLCLFWHTHTHKTSFSILLPCLRFWSKFN